MLKSTSINTWNETQEKHNELLTSLKANFRNGDWNLVAQKTGLNKENCVTAFRRMHSKNHMLIVNALFEVINERMSLLKQN